MTEQRLAMANIVGYKRVFTGVIQGPGHFTCRVVKNPVATLGRLAILPNELLDDILSKHCDIQTIVTSFSLVNRGARKAVDASLPFQRVSRYAPGALTAMLRTQVASFFTLEDLYDAYLCVVTRLRQGGCRLRRRCGARRRRCPRACHQCNRLTQVHPDAAAAAAAQ